MCAKKSASEQACWDNFAPCYLLWAVAVVYSIWSYKRLERVLREATNAAEKGAAHQRWEKAKKLSFLVFVICTIMHFVSAAWMGAPWMAQAIGACILLGVIIPICACAHGDKLFKGAGGGGLPTLVLVDSGDPRRLTLANAAAVRRGQQGPLTLASHPGYAIGRAFPERRVAFGEW